MKNPFFPTEIIAHRGASHDAPENTRAAVHLAWHQGADGVEIDVRLSRDGELVVIHDPNTLRTSGLDARVAQLSRRELQNLEVGSWKSAAFAGETIPTLDEILALVPAEKRLFIELKAPESDEIVAVWGQTLTRAVLNPTQITLIGFNYELMQSCKAALPAFGVSWLRGDAALNDGSERDFSARLEAAIQLCHAANLDGLNVSRGWLRAQDACKRIKNAGLRLDAHTINDGALARTLAAWGVDGLTTDRPAFLRQELENGESIRG